MQRLSQGRTLNGRRRVRCRACGLCPPRQKKRAGKLNKKNPILLLVAKAANFFSSSLLLVSLSAQNITALPRQFLPLRTWVTCRLLFIFLPVIESVLVLLVCLFAGPGLAIHRNRSPPPLLGLLLRDNININIKQHPYLANKQSIIAL